MFWRKRWDSNPRYPCGHAGFQDRCLKPLGHPSKSGIQARNASPEWLSLNVVGRARQREVGPLSAPARLPGERDLSGGRQFGALAWLRCDFATVAARLSILPLVAD